MKICKYCGNSVEDTTLQCPYCSATAFSWECPRCGSRNDSPFCPNCKQAEDEARQETARMRAAAEQARLQTEQARLQTEQARIRAEEVARVNQGLAWKTVLTVFVPFVGGYFLIKDGVRTGYKVFAIIWCCLLAFSVSSSSGSSTGGNLIAVLLCLLPIGVYLYKNRIKYAGDSISAKLPVVGFCVIAALTLLLAMAA